MTTRTPTTGSTSCRPRFGTPRDERFPTLGPAVGEVARRLGRPLMPWQQELMDVAYEYDPVTELLRYGEVDVTVPRQSGKTTLVLAKTATRLTAWSRKWGPQRSTYTAQTRLAARKKLERDFAQTLRSSRSFKEVLNAKARPTKASEWRLSLNNGSEAIQFGVGSFLQIDAPSRTGGHGDTLDDGTIDEAFAHEDDTVEAGMRPAMATRRNAQLWVPSTAGDHRSKYLYRKVLAGRAAHEAGVHGAVCYVEYSAPDAADPADPATWWACMPALGITISEDFIRGEWERAKRKGPEGIKTFRRAYLNQWPDVPVLGDEVDTGLAIPDGLFTAGDRLDPDSFTRGAVVLAIDVSAARVTTIAAAGWRTDGLKHIEVIQSGQGTGWVVDVVQRIVERWDPAAVLLDETVAGLLGAQLRAVKIEPTTTGGAEMAQASMGLVDELIEDRIRHRGDQPLVDAAAAAGKRSIGDGWAFNRRGGVDVSPLVAAALASWGLESLGRPAGPTPPPRSATSDLGPDRAPSGADVDLSTVQF